MKLFLSLAIIAAFAAPVFAAGTAGSAAVTQPTSTKIVAKDKKKKKKSKKDEKKDDMKKDDMKKDDTGAMGGESK